MTVADKTEEIGVIDPVEQRLIPFGLAGALCDTDSKTGVVDGDAHMRMP